MTYTKDNGESSLRKVIAVSNPRQNYLMYDVTGLSTEHLEVLETALSKIEECRENCLADFELITGIKTSSLWRSFKPEGLVWETENG
jgi:hypothetical protein